MKKTRLHLWPIFTNYFFYQKMKLFFFSWHDLRGIWLMFRWNDFLKNWISSLIRSTIFTRNERMSFIRNEKISTSNCRLYSTLIKFSTSVHRKTLGQVWMAEIPLVLGPLLTAVLVSLVSSIISSYTIILISQMVRGFKGLE